jgi:hypothetical protein
MNIDDLINSPFTFTRRKNHLACEVRPLWKLCLVVLILGISGKDKSATLKKIHVANWVVKNNEHLELFLNWAGKADKKRPNVRLDPYLDEVIDIMVSNKIVERYKGKVVLIDIGLELLNSLLDSDVYIFEKEAIKSSRKYLSEAAVQRVFEGV